MRNNCNKWEEAVLWLRSQQDQQELVRECFFDDPVLECAERYYRSDEWESVREILTRTVKGKALDLGAGRGITSYALSRDGWHVVALEPDNSDIVGAGAIRELNKAAGINIHITIGKGEYLPFDSGIFDLVYARQVLHHSDDLNALCIEICRVLKPGGLFVATREHVITKKSDLEKFLCTHPLHHLYGGESAYTLKEYLSAIKNSKVKIVQVIPPYSSEINLFPLTRELIRKKIRKNFKVPIPRWLMPVVIIILNVFDNTPGRLYSFIGRK